jgi:hypothetical protein
MPWVRFVDDFDFRPPERRRVCIAYKRGMVQFVRRVCADGAIAKGRAVETERPSE